MASCVMPGVSANCESGPPGVKLSIAKPMIDTSTSKMMLCHRRVRRYPNIRTPAGSPCAGEKAAIAGRDGNPAHYSSQ